MVHSGAVPGKLMLAGEYAVLAAGGFAIAGATVELARWRWQPGPAQVELAAYGQRWSWRPGETAPAGIGGFVDAALGRFAADGVALHGALTLEIGGQVGGRKLGLGTSAAAVVATGRGLCAGAGRPFGIGALRACDDAHRAAQDGKGSGYDVFAIGAGGLARYDRSGRRVEPLRWPAGLHAVALYAGSGADTRIAIGGRIQPDAADIESIAAAERALWRALLQGDAANCLAALGQAEEAFGQLRRRSPWLQHPGLAAIAELCTAGGGVARTSGAGGGDCALGCFTDAAAAAAVAAAWEAAGGVVVAAWPDALWPAQTLPNEEAPPAAPSGEPR